jgi:hypothetical protein
MAYMALPAEIDTTSIKTIFVRVQRQEPVSCLMTATVAAQGMNNSVTVRKARAVGVE